jgi:predicted nucleic acid-binding protein
MFSRRLKRREAQTIGLDTGFFVEMLRKNQKAFEVLRQIYEGEEACISCLTLFELRRRSLNKGTIAKDPVETILESIMSFCVVAWLDSREIHNVAAGPSHGLGIPAVDSLILAGFVLNRADAYTPPMHT